MTKPEVTKPDTTEETPTSKPQLQFPTETIELPSKGLLYPKDNPLSKGTVEIKYMTAKEEDILSNQNLIKKGVVLDRLFESILVDKFDPDDMVIGDKNAVVLATRMLGYGADYPMKFYSAIQDEVLETKVDLSKIKIKEIDYSQFQNKNHFEFTTPLGKNTIEFKILTHGDEKQIEKDIQSLQKVDKNQSAGVTTRLRYMVQSVDGNSDLGHINNFINNMLARDSKAFRDYAKRISPDMDMTFTYKHEDGEEEVVPISIGIQFFWPSEES